MEKDEEVEVVKVKEKGEEHYHIKPISHTARLYRSAKIPRSLFESYLEHRTAMLDERQSIRNYFNTPTDTPIPLREGEIASFNEDGSMTIINKQDSTKSV